MRLSRSRESGAEREGNRSGLQRALGSGSPGSTFLCSLTREPVYTQGLGTSQAPRAEGAFLGSRLPSDQPGLLEGFQIVTSLWQKLG